MYDFGEALNRARGYRWVELSHTLDNNSPYWAGIRRDRWSLLRRYTTGAIPCWTA